MKAINIRFAAIATLIVMVVCVAAYKFAQRQEEPLRQASSTKLSSLDGGAEHQQKSAKQGSNFAVGQHLSGPEFSMQRMSLPQPKAVQWKAPFFDSSTCLDVQHARAALEVLPDWIRKAVLSGETDKAAGYLHSLFQLMNDKDSELRADTALALLKPGSSDTAVLKELANVIKGSEAGLTTAGVPGQTRVVSRRQNLLEHLEFYDDHSFDLVAKEALAVSASATPLTEATAELSRFLERMGHPQPDKFWVDQLGDPDGVGLASETLSKRASPETINEMRKIFEQNPASLKGIAAASVALSFTKDAVLEQQLLAHVQKSLAEGRADPTLEPALSGLLTAKTDAGLSAAKTFLASENVVMHDIALRALSQSRHPPALTVIRDYAEQRVQAGQFPTNALQSLAMLADKEGDAAVSALKARLLSIGHSESDFALIEFIRHHQNRP